MPPPHSTQHLQRFTPEWKLLNAVCSLTAEAPLWQWGAAEQGEMSTGAGGRPAPLHACMRVRVPPHAVGGTTQGRSGQSPGREGTVRRGRKVPRV